MPNPFAFAPGNDAGFVPNPLASPASDYLAADATWKPIVGSLVTLKETVFAGITPQGFTNASVTTLDGSQYTCTLVGNSVAEIVAAGLRLAQGTTGGTGRGTQMNILAANAGNFLSIVGEPRFRRGSYGLWVRRASFDFTNAGAIGFGVFEVAHGLNWGVSLRRCKNLNGCPATATGGNANDAFWNAADIAANSYPGVSTADVMLAYVRNPERIDIYYGTWAGAWPLMENMTFWASYNLQTLNFLISSNTLLAAAPVDIIFYVGGSNATAATYEIVFDRWRVTTWE